jgi:hypothetical protein
VKYAFIRKHENEYRVSSMCRVMHVSRSGYYAWRDRPAQSNAQQNELLSQIRRVHVQSRQAYGAKKTWLALKSQGIACGKHSVAQGLKGSCSNCFRRPLHSAMAAMCWNARAANSSCFLALTSRL